MDRSGNAVAVWNIENSLQGSAFDAGSGDWSSDEPLAAGGSGKVSVVMYGSGRAFVASEGADRIQTLGFDLQVGWDAATLPLGNGPFPPLEPRLASSLYGPATRVYAVWRERIQLNPLTQFAGGFASWRVPGGTWNVAGRLDTNPTQAGASPQTIFNLRVAVAGDGTATAVWEQVTSKGEVASFAVRHSGTTWQVPFMLGSSANGATNGMPDIGMDEAGNAVAVYLENDKSYARRFDASDQTWGAPVVLGDGDLADLIPRVAVNGDGEALAVWAKLGSDAVYARRRNPGGDWTPAQFVVTGAVGLVRTLRVAIDGEGTARMLWAQSGGVWTATHDQSGIGPVENLGLGSSPDLAMAPGGRAVGVWWNDGLQRRVWEPAIPPPPVDRGEIVFASDRFNGNSELYTMKPDGSEVTRRMIHAAADTDPVWSPDRSLFCFVSDRDADLPGSTDLYVRDIDAGSITRLTFFGEDQGFARDPAWSPDGSEIAYSGALGANGIHVVEVATRDFRTLSTGGSDRWPSWSPDAVEIVYSDGSDLRLLDPFGDSAQIPQLLLGRVRVDQAPAWSPDGRTIAFVSQGIWFYGTEQGTLRQLTDDPSDRQPAWSSTSRADLLFVRDGANGSRIWLANGVTGIANEIPDQIGDNEDPDWK